MTGNCSSVYLRCISDGSRILMRGILVPIGTSDVNDAQI